MSGLLRRIKRSRPAEAGEPTPEGRAAETEGAATTTETPPPAPQEAAAATPSESGDAPGQAPEHARRRLFRRRPKQPRASAPPVLLADPNVPAGVDPAEAPMRPPAGRRGRLRRRLRYLRRARELMLRDLGGLLYEIHRTGGGNVDAHSTVVGAKVQRIAGVDAEAHALETALGAPRGETTVFEPGVGGTCATCGELYGSNARFCSNCGTPIGAVAAAKPPETAQEVVAEPARRAFWRRAARPVAPSDDTAVMGAAEGSTSHEAARGGDEAAAGTSDAAASGGDEAVRAGDEAAASARDEAEATGGDQAAPRQAPGEASTDEARAEGAEPRNPYSDLRNGRPDAERKPPGLSSGDPLVSRERS
jgi:hypothetical protein